MRFQLALNVRDLDEAIAYYTKLLGAPVNKRKPGYANFAVESPPIKLVLFEAPDAAERLNHVGFEMDADEVAAAADRLEPRANVRGGLRQIDDPLRFGVQHQRPEARPRARRVEGPVGAHPIA